MNSKFNQEFVFPEHTKRPEWVNKRLNNFFNTLKEDTSKNLSENLLRNHMIDNLEENILHSKVKIRKTITKKSLIDIINKTSDLVESGTDFMWYYYLLMQAGFTLSTVMPSSFQPEALELPKEFVQEKDKLVKKYKESKGSTEDAIAFQKGITKIAEKVKKYFEDNDIHVVDLMNSGAKGNVSHIQSLLLSVGLSINSFGEINDVIDNAHVDGLSQTQFFNGSSQAIQALYAKSSETARPGYLGRKLSTIAERIKLSTMPDCKTSKYLTVKIKDKQMLESFTGRYYKTKVGIELLLTSNSDVVGKIIELRSPLYCKAKDGICERCYGPVFVKDMHLTVGSNIGLIASTRITNSLVNSTLKKSHVGVGLDQMNVDFREEVEKML